ncbi:MAG: RNA-binding protein [Methanobrevibacter sp.]|jgi:predicted SPOUT superfamily RNA methylase MTH1|nr:RNA-binding protein [Candidatus Methanovirga australis]
MKNVRLSVFLPDSFLAETKDLKLKTSKIGIIGRALAIFNVNKAVIYKDTTENSFSNTNSDRNSLNRNNSSRYGLNRDSSNRNSFNRYSSNRNNLNRDNTDKTYLNRNVSDRELISKLLRYMDTPQYLRKNVFPIESDLKHVGILPPLRTPNHPTVENFGLGQYRQGLTVKRNKKGTFVDIGLDELAFCKEQLTVNKVFSFRITKIAKEILITPDTPNDLYWGYETTYTEKTLENSLKLVDPDFILLTTRYGDEVNSVFDNLKLKAINSKSIALIFGGPYNGIPENVCESIRAFKSDIVEVNMVPSQGTETVRTEEALISTLAILNVMLQ